VTTREFALLGDACPGRRVGAHANLRPRAAVLHQEGHAWVHAQECGDSACSVVAVKFDVEAQRLGSACCESMCSGQCALPCSAHRRSTRRRAACKACVRTHSMASVLLTFCISESIIKSLKRWHALACHPGQDRLAQTAKPAPSSCLAVLIL